MQEQNKFKEEEEKFNKAIKVDPHYFIHGSLAIAQGLSEQGKSAEAIAKYENIIDLYPEVREPFAIAYNNWGDQLNEAGKYKEAIPKFEKSTNLWPLAVCYVNWGHSLEKLGDYQGAKSKFEKAIEVEPNNAIAHYNLGAVYGLLNQADNAKRHFDRHRELTAKAR